MTFSPTLIEFKRKVTWSAAVPGKIMQAIVRNEIINHCTNLSSYRHINIDKSKKNHVEQIFL